MPKQPSFVHTKLGFSLVELSIVIVIIGILVGGIAGLQSYIRNAAIKNMLTESKVFISAFNQFQTRYKAPPGDFINASGIWPQCAAATSSDLTNHNGDGNGLIRATGSAPGNQVEWFYTFQHLALSGFIPGSYTGLTTGGGGTYHAKIGTNVPIASMQNTTFLFDHPDAADGFVSGDALYFDGNYGNILRIAGLNPNATSIPDQPFISGVRASQIDDKYDDGQPGLGNILTPKTAALANCASSATAYFTTGDDITCYLFIKIQ